MRCLLCRWLPPLGWMGVIFLLSAQSTLPHPAQPWLSILLEQLGHALAYGILAWLFLWALRGDGSASAPLRIVSVVLAAVYGASDEIHQAFVPGRHPSLLDLLTDGAGASLAMLLDWRRRRAPASSPR